MDVTNREYALELDAQDPLAKYKELFFVENPDLCYLDGNSLGRLPKRTIAVVNEYLTSGWGPRLVNGWADWIDEAEITGDLIGRAALGAAPGQVLACDTTSVNFYQLVGAALAARPGRKTIITDKGNFPTDRYILQGLAKVHNLTLIEIDNESEGATDFERITPELLEPYMSDDVAFITFEVIQYRSGARNDIKVLTDLARSYGALSIWDASHAVGALDLDLDLNGADLVVGCTYKYGNSGPGSPAWLYISHSLQNELSVPIQGWFSQRNQFAMGEYFDKNDGMRGFQIASPSIIGLRCVNTAFEMIEEAGIGTIEQKCAKGTEMMIALYDAWLADLGFSLKTSRSAKERGGHISLVHPEAKRISIALRQFANVIPDYREPNSIRVAISPLATSYVEVWDGFSRLRELTASGKYEEISETDVKVT